MRNFTQKTTHLNYKTWTSAMRLRTLPLASASIILANFLAFSTNHFNAFVGIFCLLTAILLQILSNFANDYGDYQNGADNAQRIGPARAVQSGAISAAQMKKAIATTATLCFLSGSSLIYHLILHINIWQGLAFLALGLLAIAAALFYTAGKNPYGYIGLGDASVFIFFGLMSVLGTYYLHSFTLNAPLLLPSMAAGLLSVAVLNLNNMRDIENDKNANKKTIAVFLGLQHAKYYHITILVLAWVCLIFYAFLNFKNWYQYAFLLLIIPFYIDAKQLYAIKENALLDPYLKKTAIKTLVLCSFYGFLACLNSVA